MHNKPQDSLKYLIFSRELLQEYPNISLTTAHIYSYMLARYRLFSAKNTKFFESIESISENCFCSIGSVKTALKDLSSIGLIVVGKLRSAKHNKNTYDVVDKYNLYPKQINKTMQKNKVLFDEIPPWEREEDESMLPF